MVLSFGAFNITAELMPLNSELWWFETEKERSYLVGSLALGCAYPKIMPSSGADSSAHKFSY